MTTKIRTVWTNQLGDSDMPEGSRPVEVVRPLTADEVDKFDVGFMYEVRDLETGEEWHAFADELDPRPTEERD